MEREIATRRTGVAALRVELRTPTTSASATKHAQMYVRRCRHIQEQRRREAGVLPRQPASPFDGLRERQRLRDREAAQS